MEKTGEILIRRALPEDAEIIMRIMRDTWLATYVNDAIGMTRSEIEKSYEGSLEPESIAKQAQKIAESPETELRLVAEVDGRVVGMAKGRRGELHNTFDMLYVVPKFQRRGIGSAFWQKLNSFFEADKDIELEVAPYNQTAIDFYTHYGFSDTGTRKAYPIYDGGPELPLMILSRKATNI